MLDFTNYAFGRPIKFENFKDPSRTVGNSTNRHPNQLGANAMVSQFLNVKNKYRTKLQNVAGADNDAKRFFCGNDCAFIFDLQFVKAICETIEQNGNGEGCMVLFNGLRKHCNDENNQSQGFSFGRPTLIAAAYTYGKDNNGKYCLIHRPISSSQFKLADGDDPDGFEHPGDGSGLGPDDPPFSAEKKRMEG